MGAPRPGHGAIASRAAMWATLLIVAACTSGPTSTSENPDDDHVGERTTVSAESSDAHRPGPVSDESDQLFDQETLHTFELDMTDEDLAFLDADPAAEEYVEGTLTFLGETIPVGIRYKGSVGAFVDCLSGPNSFEPSGSKECSKLSIKVKTNWTDPDDDFFGQRRLQFHSQNLDPTQMRERLGYWLFNEMGVPAPRSVHARVVINGKYSGLYALTEQIDGRFTRRVFEDGTGNLYKEVWPLDFAGFPHDDEIYLASLRTNEDDDPSAELVRSFAQELTDSSPGDAPAVLSRWLDTDETLALVVVDRAIRHDDGPFHWYCLRDEPCASHNFYWYEDPSRQRLHLIPWDLDSAFENISFDRNPVTPIADDWGQITNDCEPFRYGVLMIKQRSAACDPLVAGLVLLDDDHARLQAEFLDGPFSQANVEARLDEWVAQVRSATAEADDLHADALTISEWEAALTELRQALAFARDQLR